MGRKAARCKYMHPPHDLPPFPPDHTVPPDPSPLLPQDHYDVKMPAHLLLTTLAATEPATVLGALERVVGALEKTLTAKVKSDAVKQEVGGGAGQGGSEPKTGGKAV